MLPRVTNLPYHGFTRGHGYNRLHVESFWGSLLLSVKNILLRLLKVFLGHLEKRGGSSKNREWTKNLYLHPPLSKGEEASLSADCLDVRSREIILRWTFVMKLALHDQLLPLTWCTLQGPRLQPRSFSLTKLLHFVDMMTTFYVNLCGFQRFYAWSSHLGVGTRFSWNII